MLKKWMAVVGLGIFAVGSAWAGDQAPGPDYYRELTLRVRESAKFALPVALNSQTSFNYELQFGDPVWKEPMMYDLHWDSSKKEFTRSFWDRIFLKDGSYFQLGSEKIPLTCVFISGQDNRFNGNTSPLFPQIIMKVYLVANDFTCVGPVNPGFPSSGGKPEAWDTYIWFKIIDPTIMLPTDTLLRYRWAEVTAILTDSGGN